jgi:3-methyl-2-oxobutanoate hydroxymethyltransferase
MLLKQYTDFTPNLRTEMKDIYTWDSRRAKRNLTIRDLIDKNNKKLIQVTVKNKNDVLAASEANIDMLITHSINTKLVREYNKEIFLTASLKWQSFNSKTEIMKAAVNSLEMGADAVITQRSLKMITHLAEEGIPVMGHLGLVPRKSSWLGGLRAVGKTFEEAKELYQNFLDLENAGAFGVECELIPSNLMKIINTKTKLATISLGSGPHTDVIFSFMEDICGENETQPKHTKKYCDLFKLNEEIQKTKIRALKQFSEDAKHNVYPSDNEIVKMKTNEYEKFLNFID